MRGNASPVKYISRFHKEHPVLSVSFHITLWNHCILFLHRLSKHSNPCLSNPRTQKYNSHRCNLPRPVSFRQFRAHMLHTNLTSNLFSVIFHLTGEFYMIKISWLRAKTVATGCPPNSRNLWKSGFKQNMTIKQQLCILNQSTGEVTQNYFSQRKLFLPQNQSCCTNNSMWFSALLTSPSTLYSRDVRHLKAVALHPLLVQEAKKKKSLKSKHLFS